MGFGLWFEHHPNQSPKSRDLWYGRVQTKGQSHSSQSPVTLGFGLWHATHSNQSRKPRSGHMGQSRPVQPEVCSEAHLGALPASGWRPWPGLASGWRAGRTAALTWSVGRVDFRWPVGRSCRTADCPVRDDSGRNYNGRTFDTEAIR